MKTEPKHFLDLTLGLILKIFLEPFSRKKSHFWHWRDYSAYRQDILNSGKFLSFPADHKAGKKTLIRLVAIRTPSAYWAKDYRVGYICGERCKLCSLILNEPVCLLLSDQEIKFFAVDLKGQLFNLRNHGKTSRKEERKFNTKII